MTIWTWILLGLAIVDVLFAVIQLTILNGYGLIVYGMKPVTAWLVVVGPSVLVLVLAIVSLNLPTQLHPHSGPAVLIVGYVVFLLVMVFQAAAMKPIFQHEWDADNEQRLRTASYHS